MKHKILTTAIALALIPSAGNARESLFKAEVPTETSMSLEEKPKALDEQLNSVEASTTNTPTIANEKPKPHRARISSQAGIESGAAVEGVRSYLQIPQGNSTIRASGVSDRLLGMKVGEAHDAYIPMSLLAFKGAKAPVVARVKLDGEIYQILGEASVEPNSKRVTIDFVKIRKNGSDIVYEMLGVAVATDGTYGIEGVVHSGEGKFFLAEVLSAAAAGFVDASVNRSTNALGNTQDERSLDTQSKKALSTAAMKTSERFAEKVKTAPEYVTVQGPLNVILLVTTAPYRKL